MARVTKEMTMGELLQTYYEQCPEIVDVLTGLGMHCIGCPSSIGESLEEAAMVHGINSDAQALSENHLQMLHMFTELIQIFLLRN